MQTPIRLIVGLGNPGPQYSNTRHNAGAWFVQSLTEQQHTSLRRETKFSGDYQKISLHGHDCHLLIPTTFMNLSGTAVAAVAHFFKIPVNAILVAHDELDLPAGIAKLKHGGGHAGHNGLRDMIAKLGSADFYRLRLGIGHPGSPEKVTSYVLNAPGKLERQAIDDAIAKSLLTLPDLLTGHFAKAMKELHTTG